MIAVAPSALPQFGWAKDRAVLLSKKGMPVRGHWTTQEGLDETIRSLFSVSGLEQDVIVAKWAEELAADVIALGLCMATAKSEFDKDIALLGGELTLAVGMMLETYARKTGKDNAIFNSHPPSHWRVEVLREYAISRGWLDHGRRARWDNPYGLEDIVFTCACILSHALDHVPQAVRSQRDLKRTKHIGTSAELGAIEVNCSSCGKKTAVPFRPSQGHLVRCRECFLQERRLSEASFT
jgi:CxxC-x17-CxxC domain-containing protein